MSYGGRRILWEEHLCVINKPQYPCVDRSGIVFVRLQPRLSIENVLTWFYSELFLRQNIRVGVIKRESTEKDQGHTILLLYRKPISTARWSSP